MTTRSKRVKETFYTWWHKSDAGIAHSWEECEAYLKGNPGRNSKKFDNEEEAKALLTSKLENIHNFEQDSEPRRRSLSDSNISATIAQQTVNTNSEENTTILEGMEKTMECIKEFEQSQSLFNDTLEKAITSEIDKSNSLNERLEDQETRLQNKLKDLILHFNNKMEEIKEELKQKITEEMKSVKKILSSIQKDVGNITKKTDKIETACHASRDNQSPPQKDHTTQADQKNVNHEEDICVETPLSTRNRFQALSATVPHAVTPQRNTNSTTPGQQNGLSNSEPTSLKGPILIIADSMARGIKQTLLSTECYVNKQVLNGGKLPDAISHVASMEDVTNYKQVLIHLGTNDVKEKHKTTFLEEMQTLKSSIRSKWPNCKLIISGVIEHKTDREKNSLISELNRDLRDLCENTTNSSFCDNSRLTRRRDGSLNENVFFDDQHLNNLSGTRILAANFKDALGLRNKQKNGTPQFWHLPQNAGPRAREPYNYDYDRDARRMPPPHERKNYNYQPNIVSQFLQWLSQTNGNVYDSNMDFRNGRNLQSGHVSRWA